jgi:hypothetical protein
VPDAERIELELGTKGCYQKKGTRGQSALDVYEENNSTTTNNNTKIEIKIENINNDGDGNNNNNTPPALKVKDFLAQQHPILDAIFESGGPEQALALISALQDVSLHLIFNLVVLDLKLSAYDRILILPW